jgi:hypothetical protein
LASFDPDSRCWRTFQATLASELPRFSQTLPRSGMTRRGRLYELPMSGRPIDGSDGSAWLTTPNASHALHPGVKTIKEGQQRHLSADVIALLGTPTVLQVRGEPARRGRSPNPAEIVALNVPTPTASDAVWSEREHSRRGIMGNHNLGLVDWVKTLPTPAARDWKGTGMEGQLPTLLGELTKEPSEDGSE